MRKVELNMNEEEKYEAIKDFVDSGETKNKKRIAAKLGCSVRSVNRWISLYKKHGKSAFVHGNRGRKPATAFPKDQKRKIITYYKDAYADCTFEQFSEICEEDFDIEISPMTLNYWFREELILSPKARKQTKKKMEEIIRNRLQETSSKKEQNEMKETLESLEDSQAHPRRPRCKYMGELLQMDASEFYWIPGVKWHLHIAVDDASGAIHGAYFDTQETLNGYYHVLHQILTNYGIPLCFLTDRRTVFEYKRKNTLMDEDDTFTQFAYACKQLGTEIKTTSVAQAKGRVERMNQTLQSRLPIELRRAHITTIEQANEFLKSYLKKFNSKFALQLNSTKTVYEQQPEEEKINQILAVISERTLDKGHCAKFKNNYYLPMNAKGMHSYFIYKTKCLMIESFDGRLYMSIGDTIYLADKVETHEKISKAMGEEVPVKKEKKVYIPPITHPWKQQSFFRFKQKQMHRTNL